MKFVSWQMTTKTTEWAVGSPPGTGRLVGDSKGPRHTRPQVLERSPGSLRQIRAAAPRSPQEQTQSSAKAPWRLNNDVPTADHLLTPPPPGVGFGAAAGSDVGKLPGPPGGGGLRGGRAEERVKHVAREPLRVSTHNGHSPMGEPQARLPAGALRNLSPGAQASLRASAVSRLVWDPQRVCPQALVLLLEWPTPGAAGTERAPGGCPRRGCSISPLGEERLGLAASVSPSRFMLRRPQLQPNAAAHPPANAREGPPQSRASVLLRRPPLQPGGGQPARTPAPSRTCAPFTLLLPGPAPRVRALVRWHWGSEAGERASLGHTLFTDHSWPPERLDVLTLENR